jgi:RNA polymerase sigma-70 factor (ECF subfamily)
VSEVRSDAASAGRAQLSEALSEVGRGSRAAMEQVYQKTSAKLFGICLRILGSRSEAEDALQDIYISVWRKAGSFDPARASPITWLATLARNRAIDRLRASGSRPTSGIEEASDVADPGEDALTRLEARQESGRLHGCMDELEERQSTAIRAAFFNGLTYSELAERTKVPLGTMKSWVRRGLIRLKECLEG